MPPYKSIIIGIYSYTYKNRNKNSFSYRFKFKNKCNLTKTIDKEKLDNIINKSANSIKYIRSSNKYPMHTCKSNNDK